MTLVNGAVITLSADDCVRLDRMLLDAIRFGWLNRHAIPPRDLVEHADEVHRAAAQYRPMALTSRSGTVTVPPPQSASSSQDEVWLSTRETAALLGCSEGFARKIARRGAITAQTAVGGGWRFPRSEVYAYASARRAKTDD